MGSQRVRHDWVTNTHIHISGPIKCHSPPCYEMQFLREERNWKLRDIQKSQSPRNQTDYLWSPSLTGLNGFHTAGAPFLEPHSIVLLHISISDHNLHLENGQRRFNLKPWARPHFQNRCKESEEIAKKQSLSLRFKMVSLRLKSVQYVTQLIGCVPGHFWGRPQSWRRHCRLPTKMLSTMLLPPVFL